MLKPNSFFGGKLVKIVSLTIFYLFVTFTYVIAQWETHLINGAGSFRATNLSPNGNIWLCGSKGGLWVSQDKGKNWQNKCPEKYKELDFRGIAVLNDQEIIAMSAGEAELEKAILLKSLDGGSSWKEIFTITTKGAFFDCIKFKNNLEGYLLSDAIDHKLLVYKTTDGGDNWVRINEMPDIIKGEASFAASNSNICISRNNVWIVTQSRVFHSKNNGNSFEVLGSPFIKSSTGGIFGVFRLTKKQLWLCGGDYQDNKTPVLQLAYSIDDGKSWKTDATFTLPGLIESLVLIKKTKALAIGTTGSYVLDLKTKKLTKIDDKVFHVGIKVDQSIVAGGAKGLVGIKKID